MVGKCAAAWVVCALASIPAPAQPTAPAAFLFAAGAGEEAARRRLNVASSTGNTTVQELAQPLYGPMPDDALQFRGPLFNDSWIVVQEPLITSSFVTGSVCQLRWIGGKKNAFVTLELYIVRKISDYEDDYHRKDDDGELKLPHGQEYSEADPTETLELRLLIEEAEDELFRNTGFYDWKVPESLRTQFDYRIRLVIDGEEIWAPARGGFRLREVYIPGRSFLWLVGVIMSILASTSSNLGVNVQKFSMMKEVKTMVKSKQRGYARQPLWVFGFVLVFLGSIGDFAALGMASQSLVAPVGGFTMVANVFFAALWLKEKLGKLTLVATSLICVGIIVIGISASKKARAYSLEELVDLYSEVGFIIYAVSCSTITVVLWCTFRYCDMMMKKYGWEHQKYQKFRRIHPFSAASLSGVLGGQTVLFAKSTIELLKASAQGDQQLTKVGTYGIAGAMVFFIFGQIHWLARALQHFDAMYCVPVFQGFFISVSIVGGGVYFHEFEVMSKRELIGFGCGVGCTLIGVYLLTMRTMNATKPITRFKGAVYAVRFVHRTSKSVASSRYLASEDDSPVKQAGTGEAASDAGANSECHMKVSREPPVVEFTPAVLPCEPDHKRHVAQCSSGIESSVSDDSVGGDEGVIGETRSFVPHPPGTFLTAQAKAPLHGQ